MKKIGVITQKMDDYALVMVGHSATCGNCGCGALTRKDGELCDNNHQFIKVKNSIDGEIGDPVNIEFQTRKMLKTSFLLYILPLIMLVIGIIIGNAAQGENPKDVLSFGLGVIFLALSYFIISRIDKKNSKEELITISKFKGM